MNFYKFGKPERMWLSSNLHLVVFMAHPEYRLPENVPGPFYVTDNCIDCDMCRDKAPTVFRREESLGGSVVFRQPETVEELTLAVEALEDCPVEAIGNDG